VSLGAKLVGERQARGLSQRALARELGVGLRSVLRWENGENEPSGLYARVVEDWIARKPESKRRAR
jgi:transcriptional regulator with XRE-family HTH domain